MFLLHFSPGTIGRAGGSSIDFFIAPGLMLKFPSSLQSSIGSIRVLGSRIEDTVPTFHANSTPDSSPFHHQAPSTRSGSSLAPRRLYKIKSEDGKALNDAKRNIDAYIASPSSLDPAVREQLSASVAQWKELLR